MDRQEFEAIVEEIFEQLPQRFHDAIENVAIVVEDYPNGETVNKLHLRSKYDLLGLYQGIPLTVRTTSYGMNAVIPDRISLYQKNIESHCSNDKELRAKIYEVLIHEIGHYFGMNEEEIRAAGY
jgi:predicted Zn-dependent protease with MMP-like domain